MAQVEHNLALKQPNFFTKWSKVAKMDWPRRLYDTISWFHGGIPNPNSKEIWSCTQILAQKLGYWSIVHLSLALRVFIVY